MTSRIEIPQAHGRPSYDSEKEIWRTLCAYCERIDAADIDGVARLWEHGKWPFVDEPGSEPVRRWLADHLMLYDGQTHTKHQLTNTLIDVDDETGTAAFTSHASIWQALPGNPLQLIIYTRIDGAFERLDGRWWWRSFELIPELVGDTSQHVRG